MPAADTDAAIEARRGTVVAGRYELVRVLGVGGMGAVYEAVHRFTGRRVAVKLLHPEYSDSREASARFLREARAPTSIGHPNLVEVLDAGVADDGGLYLVLELLEGETLLARVRDDRCTPRDLVRIALDLLDALAAAHARGLVHRDLKPANVFLTAARVKLLDFGIARQMTVHEPVTQVGVIVGTRDYMAPEQALGANVDGRTDVWGLGATLFRCLTGRTPLIRDERRNLLRTFLEQPIPSLGNLRPDLPDALVDAVDRALAKNPEARWPDAEAMAAPLRTALIELERETAPAAVKPPRGRRRTVAAVVAATGLVLGALVLARVHRPAAGPPAHVATPRRITPPVTAPSIAWPPVTAPPVVVAMPPPRIEPPARPASTARARVHRSAVQSQSSARRPTDILRGYQ